MLGRSSESHDHHTGISRNSDGTIDNIQTPLGHAGCSAAAPRTWVSDINLASVDLNLLVALEALLERCNVTRAADAVGLSQPAMSRALSRLRGIFNDELLVRTSNGYVRTVRGEQLHNRLSQTLDAVREIIASRSSQSEEWSSAFRVAMPDHQALVLLPHMWNWLDKEMMNTEIVVEPLTPNLWKRLEHGELEVAVGHVTDAPNGIFQRSLYKDEYVSLMRREHPILGEAMTAERFRELQHAVIAPGHDAERSSVTDVLASVPLKNRCVLSPNTLGTAIAVAESDAVLTVPRRVATKLATLLPLQMIDLPIEVAPYEALLFWHERCHKSAEHGRMRSQIATAAQGVTSRGADPGERAPTQNC